MTPTTLVPNYIGTTRDPLNIAILDVDEYIIRNRVEPVTSTLVFEPSTNIYHPGGLYSEEIFGPVGSPDRMLKFGYIDLNTTIFNPKIFKLLVQLKSLYKDIMSGSTYAVFNPVTKDFERVTGDPINTPGADTGYTFFLNHFYEINFPKTESSRRDERIEVIEQYKDRALINKYLVEPAGLRDISNDNSNRLVQDDVNKLYTSLKIYTRSIPKGSTSIFYDPVRYQIQSKAQEIYEYLENFLDGKRGFIQGSFARRKVAMGTRNVITAAPYISSSPDDPQMLKTDDVMVGVYQTIKGLQPFTKFGWFSIFGNPVFKPEATSKVALSDIQTGELVYTTISPSTRDKWMSSDGINKVINSFDNPEMRKKPVLIKDIEGKDYALSLVYDDGNEIAICRSIDDLKDRWPRPINKAKLRPITYIEVFYLIAETILVGKHAVVTRYPVIEQGSSYVARIHVASTTPARKVDLIDMLSPSMEKIPLKQYPIIGNSYMDATMVHPSKLGGMGADFDGDTSMTTYFYPKNTMTT